MLDTPSTGPSHGKVVICGAVTEHTLAERKHTSFSYEHNATLDLCTHLVTRDPLTIGRMYENLFSNVELNLY